MPGNPFTDGAVIIRQRKCNLCGEVITIEKYSRDQWRVSNAGKCKHWMKYEVWGV